MNASKSFLQRNAPSCSTTPNRVNDKLEMCRFPSCSFSSESLRAIFAASHFVIPPFPFNTFWTNGQKSEKESWIRLKSPSFHSTSLLFTSHWELRGNLCGIFTTESMYILPFFYFFARCRRCRYAKCDFLFNGICVRRDFRLFVAVRPRDNTIDTHRKYAVLITFFSRILRTERQHDAHTAIMIIIHDSFVHLAEARDDNGNALHVIHTQEKVLVTKVPCTAEYSTHQLGVSFSLLFFAKESPHCVGVDALWIILSIP